MRIVGYQDLRGWTDGPKFVIDTMNCVDWKKVPSSVHGVAQSSMDDAFEWVETIAKDFPYLEFFIAAPLDDVEQLAKQLPNAIIHKLRVDNNA